MHVRGYNQNPACISNSSTSSHAPRLVINLLAKPEDQDFCGVLRLTKDGRERGIPVTVHIETGTESEERDKYFFLTCKNVSISQDSYINDSLPREPPSPADVEVMNGTDFEVRKKLGDEAKNPIHDETTTTTTSGLEIESPVTSDAMTTIETESTTTTDTIYETTTDWDADHDHMYHHRNRSLAGASLIPLGPETKGDGQRKGSSEGHHNSTTKVQMHEEQHVLIHDWLMALLICFALLLLVLLLVILIMCTRMSCSFTKQKVIDEYNVDDDDGKQDFDYYYNNQPVVVKY